MTRVVLLHTHLTENPSIDEQEGFDVAQVIAAELQKMNHEVILLPFKLNMEESMNALQQARPDFVFNLVDDIAGSDSLHFIASAMLEHAGYNYTGASADILFITSHKLLTKRLLHTQGVPTPAWVSVDEAENFTPGLPYIIKPVNHDASIGIHEDALYTPTSLEDLRQQLTRRKALTGWNHFAEQYITGREFWVSMLGNTHEPEIFPPVEMQFSGYLPNQAPQWITYKAKWERDSFEYKHLGAQFNFEVHEEPLLQHLKQVARASWQALHLHGYVRIDLKVDAQGRPWLLEVNVNPYLPFHPGGFLDAAQHAGWDFPRLLTEILQQNLHQPQPQQNIS